MARWVGTRVICMDWSGIIPDLQGAFALFFVACLRGYVSDTT